MKLQLPNLLHRAFQVGIAIKGLDGVLETLAGLAVLMTSQDEIHHLVAELSHGGLIESPHGLLARVLLHSLQHVSVGTRHFAAFYLIGHGVLKMGLVGAMWRGWRRSYPVAIVVMGLFIVFELHRIAHTHSLLLGTLACFDAVTVALIWREWRAVTRRAIAQSTERRQG